ncbi:hypothetical protein FAIPA1_260006 [Frankia sp. AiPs1]
MRGQCSERSEAAAELPGRRADCELARRHAIRWRTMRCDRVHRTGQHGGHLGDLASRKASRATGGRRQPDRRAIPLARICSLSPESHIRINPSTGFPRGRPPHTLVPADMPCGGSRRPLLRTRPTISAGQVQPERPIPFQHLGDKPRTTSDTRHNAGRDRLVTCRPRLSARKVTEGRPVRIRCDQRATVAPTARVSTIARNAGNQAQVCRSACRSADSG